MCTNISMHANRYDPINIIKFVMKKPLTSRPHQALEASGFFTKLEANSVVWFKN